MDAINVLPFTQRFRHMGTRATAFGLCGFTDPYYFGRISPSAGANMYVSMWTIGEKFGFGTYQWKHLLVNIGANRSQLVGFEWRHGWANLGLISAECVYGTYQLRTCTGGNSTTIPLTAQDWTVEKIMKIVWDSTFVQLYIDGGLVGTSNTNIPQTTMDAFLEPYTGAEAPAVEFAVETWKEFQKLA